MTWTPTAFDLFAGPGGLTLGLKLAGFHVVAAVEKDPVAVATYRANHPEVAIHAEDIRIVEPEMVLQRAGLRAGELALLAGCPPCQGFSSVRTLNGGRHVDDVRNDLICEYVRFVAAVRPKAILLENVPGLGQDARMQAALKELESLGYPAGDGVRILDAADYGVPQRRRRLVLLTGMGATVAFPAKRHKRVTVRDAIGHLPQAGSSGDELHDLPEVRSDRVMRIIRQVPRDGGGRLDLPPPSRLNCHHGFDGFKDVYGRMRWDEVAPTITGGCHNPSKGRFLHPTEDRAITLREAAVLQSFPRSYGFSLQRGKLVAAAMIGNALPPIFVQAHAAAVRDHLKV